MITLNNVHIEFNTCDCSICQTESETAVGMTLLHMDLFLCIILTSGTDYFC